MPPHGELTPGPAAHASPSSTHSCPGVRSAGSEGPGLQEDTNQKQSEQRRQVRPARSPRAGPGLQCGEVQAPAGPGPPSQSCPSRRRSPSAWPRAEAGPKGVAARGWPPSRKRPQPRHNGPLSCRPRPGRPRPCQASSPTSPLCPQPPSSQPFCLCTPPALTETSTPPGGPATAFVRQPLASPESLAAV